MKNVRASVGGLIDLTLVFAGLQNEFHRVKHNVDAVSAVTSQSCCEILDGAFFETIFWRWNQRNVLQDCHTSARIFLYAKISRHFSYI